MRVCRAPTPSSDARAALRARLLCQGGAYDPIATHLSDCIDCKMAVHPYARGPDLANDELGYGEEVEVPIGHDRGGVLTSSLVVEIRTKTGTIIEEP